MDIRVQIVQVVQAVQIVTKSKTVERFKFLCSKRFERLERLERFERTIAVSYAARGGVRRS